MYSPGVIPNERVDMCVLDEVSGHWSKQTTTGPLCIQFESLKTIQCFRDSGEIVVSGFVSDGFPMVPTTVVHDVNHNRILPNMGVDRYEPRWMESYNHTGSLICIEGMEPLLKENVCSGSSKDRETAMKKTAMAEESIVVPKEFDREKERSLLEEQGLEIAENQENRQKNRQKLAESTRGFKKASTEEKLRLLNSLIKSYQQEVDNLTKRAQSEEDGAAKQSGVNLLMDEVERVQTCLQSLEREGVLHSQLQSAKDEHGNDSDDVDSNSIPENSLSAQERVISELYVELHNIETTLSNEREQYTKEIERLSALLYEKDVALEETKKELQARPTEKFVDDLRKKVNILQVRLSEKTALLEADEGKITELTATVNEQQRLIQKLEDDISKEK